LKKLKRLEKSLNHQNLPEAQGGNVKKNAVIRGVIFYR